MKGRPYDLGSDVERRKRMAREVRLGREKRVGVKGSPYDLNAVAARMRDHRRSR